MGKDKLDPLETPGVVYKIKCKDCDASYVGMSKRKLKKRIYEHKYAIKNSSPTSALSEHVSQTNHKIDFDNTKIIDVENNYYKRTFSEMLNIHSQKNSLNRIEDTKNLKQIYKDSIKIIKNKFQQNKQCSRPAQCPLGARLTDSESHPHSLS